ncbi:Gmad2 immunoglobulin-like domain-containing protein [Nocardioides ultimimeridianus]
MTNPLRRTAPVTVAALLGLGLLAGCGSNGAQADAGTTTPATTASSPTTAATTNTSATSATSAAASDATALVYYLTKTSLGDRITAEPTGVRLSDRLATTWQALLQGSPIDPDYSTAIPAGSLSGNVSFDGTGDAGTYQVTLTDAKWATLPAGTTAAQAKLAEQQIAYTLNAAGGTKKAAVDFLIDHKPTTFLGQPASVKPGKQLQTLALVNVLSPVDGSTLSATKTSFSGLGSSFEATIGWKITDSTGKTVMTNSTMSQGWEFHLWPWKTTIDLSKLSPGTYTFTAGTDDAAGGEGPGPITDTKTFTIG